MLLLFWLSVVSLSSEDGGRRSGRVAAQPFRQSAIRAFATLTLGC